MPTKTVPINGERLKRLRLARIDRRGKKWTQQHLSSLSDVSRSYIAEVENGDKKPSIHIAKALADALDVGLEDLISS